MRHRAILSALAAISFVGCGGAVSASSDARKAPPGPSAAPLAVDPGGDVRALATSPDRVCWSSYDAEARASLVACVTKGDGQRVDFVRDQLVHPAIAVTGPHLYWSTEMTATIERAPLAGGASEPVVQSRGPHGRFLATPSELYWMVDAGRNDTQLFAASIVGDHPGTSFELGSMGPADPDLLAVVDISVYAYPLAFSFGDGVQRVHAGSGERPTRLSNGCFYPVDLAVGDGVVAWSCQDGTFHWSGWNGEAEHVETGVGSGHIAVADDVVYVTDVAGRVLRLRPGAAHLEVVHEGLDRPTFIAVDASGIYVAEQRTIRRHPL